MRRDAPSGCLTASSIAAERCRYIGRASYERGCKERELMQIAIGRYMAETSTAVSRLLTSFALTPAHAREEITSRAWTRVSKVGSIALTVALIEAQSLRSHAFYLLIKCA